MLLLLHEIYTYPHALRVIDHANLKARSQTRMIVDESCNSQIPVLRGFVSANSGFPPL